VDTKRGTPRVGLEIDITNEVRVLKARHSVIDTGLLLVLSDVSIPTGTTEQASPARHAQNQSNDLQQIIHTLDSPFEFLTDTRQSSN
jgi:hypothetical protein